MADLIIQKERKLDNLRLIIEAWSVPEKEKFPDRIKYSYQAYKVDTGQTVLRYDNHNRHAGSRDHKHIGNRTEKLEFTPRSREDLENLFHKFIEEVKKLR